MDTLIAFGKVEANRGKPLKVFDWNKAASFIKENNIKNASAGLAGDWEWTGGEILRDGKIVNKEDTYVYLASTWATPELEVEYQDGHTETFDCYLMQSETDNWDGSTYWPDSAKTILSTRWNCLETELNN